jgi:hypothetical protein
MQYFRDLTPPNHLNSGDVLFSATRNMQLIMQADGNLVLYVIDDASLPQDITQASYVKPVWSSGTNGDGPGHCDMQNDGNLVVYNTRGKPWSSGTQGNPGAFLRCQDDGNLVVFGPNGAILWPSKTSAGPRAGTNFGKAIPIGDDASGGTNPGFMPPDGG